MRERLIALIGAGILCCQIAFAQEATQRWAHIEATSHQRFQYDVHLQQGANTYSPEETSALLEAHPNIDAVKFDPVESRLQLYMAQSASLTELEELLSMFDLPLDRNWYAMYAHTEQQTNDKVLHPVLVKDEGKLQTYLVDLPTDISAEAQTSLLVAFKLKEMVVSIDLEQDTRLRLVVKNKFTATMIKELLSATLDRD